LKLYNIVSDGGEHVGTILLKTDEVGSLLYTFTAVHVNIDTSRLSF